MGLITGLRMKIKWSWVTGFLIGFDWYCDVLYISIGIVEFLITWDNEDEPESFES